MKRLLVVMLCLGFLMVGVSGSVIAGGGQVQNREQGAKDNHNDNGERTRNCNRFCIDCGAPLSCDYPVCPECGCPQPL
jgi:membrane protease subunit (stomatin/prohibitin family)